MLEQISWKEFIITIGGITAVYYGVLVVAGKIRDRNKPPVQDPASPAFPGDPRSVSPGPTTAPIGNEHRRPLQSEEKSEEAEETEDPEFSLLEQLADEIQVIITQFAATPGDKEQLLEYMAREIAQYPMLNKPAFRRAINNLIIKVTKEECDLQLSEEDVNQVWPTLPYDSQA